MNSFPASELDQLLVGARKDPWWYEEVVRAVQGPLLSCLRQVARCLGLPEQDAEDGVQEGLMRGFVNVHRYDPAEGSGLAWLRAICVNCLRDRARHEARRRTVSLWDKDGRLRREPADRHQFAGARLQEQEAEAVLRQVLEQMGEPAREIVALRRGTPLTLAAIAAETGCAPGTVGSALFRVKARLKTVLGA